MLTEMAAGKPDVIVFELGDGILGAYGVEAILDAPDIRELLTAVVLSAMRTTRLQPGPVLSSCASASASSPPPSPGPPPTTRSASTSSASS